MITRDVNCEPRNRSAHPGPTEAQLQRSFVEFLDVSGVSRACVVLSVPNEGRRSFATAAVLKSLGMLPGAADLVIVAPGGRAHFVETKTARGRLSPAQKAFQRRCQDLGIPHTVARSLDALKQALGAWGLLIRAGS